MTTAVAVETRTSHRATRVRVAPAPAPRSLSCQVRDITVSRKVLCPCLRPSEIISDPNASRSTGSGPPWTIENTRIALKELPLAENAARCGKVCKKLSHLPAIENQSTRTLWSPPPIGDSPAAMAGHFDGLCHGPTTIKGSRCYLGGSGSAHETAASCPVQHYHRCP